MCLVKKRVKKNGLMLEIMQVMRLKNRAIKDGLLTKKAKYSMNMKSDRFNNIHSKQHVQIIFRDNFTSHLN